MTSAPTHNQDRNEESATSIHSIFEDPAIQEAAKNDVFVRFVSKHWVSTVVTLVAIAALMIAYSIFTTTAEKKRAQATMLLTDIQETYRSFVSKQESLDKLQQEQAKSTTENDKKELQSKIETASKEVDQVKTKVNLMIASLDSPEPFDTLAALYKGLVAGRSKDFDTVRTVLSARSWEQVGKKGSSERFMGEVMTLALAKSLAQSDANITQAKDTLRSLAERGEFVAVEAVDALSIAAATPEEKAKVKGLVADVKSRFPAQSKRLTDISERLDA